jgi:hypothetical protein
MQEQVLKGNQIQSHWKQMKKSVVEQNNTFLILTLQ